MADAGRHSQPVSAPWQRSSVEPVSKPSGQWLRVAEYATYFVVVAATILLLAPPFSRHLRQECHRSPRCRYWLRPTFLHSTPLGAVVMDTDVADSQWRDLRTSAPELLGECTFTVVVCIGSCSWRCHAIAWHAGGMVLFCTASWVVRWMCRRRTFSTLLRARIGLYIAVSAGTLVYLHGSYAVFVVALACVSYFLGALSQRHAVTVLSGVAGSFFCVHVAVCVRHSILSPGVMWQCTFLSRLLPPGLSTWVRCSWQNSFIAQYPSGHWHLVCQLCGGWTATKASTVGT